MFQSRDEVRQMYLAVWHKLQQKMPLEPMEALIADVIEIHPEYHNLLETGDDVRQQEFTPEQGQTNPFLHMGMHIALREQATADRPPGVKAIHQKLLTRKGQHKAEHDMMECLGESLWSAQRNNQLPDEAAYLDCLKKV
jgi:hypothetical protein